ncbi:MAG: TIGR00366 family protein [Lachnospiraceae bacterium]
MFKRFTNACVRVVNRWLPDAFLFAVILTFVVYVATMFATGMGPIKVLAAWGNSDGFWGLLAFSMQMALVLVLGSAMASAKPCKKVLRKAAGLCHAIICRPSSSPPWSPPCAAGSTGASVWWPVQLLAKEVAKRVPTVDYPLLIASAYSGFVIWHAESFRIHSPNAGHRRQVR